MLRRILAAASVATIASVVSIGTGNAGNAGPISVPMTVTGIQSSAIPAAYVVKKKIIVKKKRGWWGWNGGGSRKRVTGTAVVVKRHRVTTRAVMSVKKLDERSQDEDLGLQLSPPRCPLSPQAQLVCLLLRRLLLFSAMVENLH